MFHFSFIGNILDAVDVDDDNDGIPDEVAASGDFEIPESSAGKQAFYGFSGFSGVIHRNNSYHVDILIL